MGKGSGKVPVSVRALLARINRKLANESETLKQPRSEQLRREVGDYYVLDLHNNRIGEKHIDPVKYGRELGVLKPWEEVRE